MVELGRRTTYALLLALVSVNVLARLPTVEHESGLDSFYIHNLATSISDRGRADWILNPLGYFGWYPLSYPSAGPYLISGLAQTADITEEGAILLLSISYGAAGVLVAFLMARAFRRDDLFALVVALLFSLAPRFLTFTTWSASTRNLFMLLVPVFLWAFIRSYRRPSLAHLLVFLSILTMMLATHRLTVLLSVVVIAFVIAYVFILLHHVMRIRFPRLLLSPRTRKWTPRLALLGIVCIAGYMLFLTDTLDQYAVGELCTGTSVEAKLCNLGGSITRSVGLGLPFALGGVFVLVRERGKGFIEAFLVLSLLALVPTLFLRQYTGFYILPFVALFGAFGVLGVARALRRRRRIRNAVVVATLVVISGFSFGLLRVEVQRATVMGGSEYSTGLYLQALPAGNFVSNDGLLTSRLASVSGRGGLPVGGASTTGQSPELLIMGVYNASEVKERETRIPITDLTIEDDSPFYLQGIDARTDWIVKVLQRDADDVVIRPGYRLQYFVESDYFRGAFTAYGNIYRGIQFALSNHAERYKIYDGTTEDIYLSFPPLA